MANEVTFDVRITITPTELNDLAYYKRHGISEDDILDAVAGAVCELDLFEEADVSAEWLPVATPRGGE